MTFTQPQRGESIRLGRQRSYKLNDAYCKTPYDKAMDGVISSAQAIKTEKHEIKKKTPKKFLPPDPRCEQCYYWRMMSSYGNFRKACHYALIEGKLREKISKTECGSFLDKADAPDRKLEFDSVPMSQWGCGGWKNRG